jgi:hypothetical protein
VLCSSPSQRLGKRATLLPFCVPPLSAPLKRNKEKGVVLCTRRKEKRERSTTIGVCKARADGMQNAEGRASFYFPKIEIVDIDHQKILF